MEEEVMPAILAESCERDAISAEQRLAAIHEGSQKIAAREKTLESTLTKMDSVLREIGPKTKPKKYIPLEPGEVSGKEKNCDIHTEISLWLTRVRLNSVSCEMYFAKLRLTAVAARMERGIASVAPCVPGHTTEKKKKAELEDEYLKELEGA